MTYVVRARAARGKGLRSRAAARRKADLAAPRTRGYDLPPDPGRAAFRPQSTTAPSPARKDSPMPTEMYANPPYKNASTQKAERKDASRAAGFEPNQQLERALQLRDEDPASYAALSPSTKTALAYYVTSKAAAERAIDTPGDAA